MGLWVALAVVYAKDAMQSQPHKLADAATARCVQHLQLLYAGEGIQSPSHGVAYAFMRLCAAPAIGI